MDGDIGGLEIGHELGIGVQLFAKREPLSRVFLDGIAADFERRP